MVWNQLNAVAYSNGRRGVAGHPSIGVGVAEPGLPLVGHIPLELGFQPVHRVASRQYEETGIVRVGQRNICPDQLVHRSGKEQPWQDVPFDTDFLVYEFLRCENKRTARERAELVAGGRKI